MTNCLPDLPTQFETKRLILRSYQQGDGVMYYDVARRNRDHLERYERNNTLRSIQSAEEAEIIVHSFQNAWFSKNYFLMGAFEKTSGSFVAQVYIGVVNKSLPEFGIGYLADVDQQGKGYVTESVKEALKFIFGPLKAQRLQLETDDTNQRSIRVARRCGFKQEAHFRKNTLNPDGTISGTLFFGMLQSEYQTSLTPSDR